ncbi:MAG TPA: hypothetical protein VHD87_15880 [Acidimicrobiales bacterium]|nr:hypothetical protein [Acidimicrobiales bacterium]
MTDPVDALFAGALDDFVKRRDALVRELKQAGDKETAAAVKALRKPSTAAWAVNQAARRNPDAVDALVAAARAVHAAQAAAVQGRDGGGLRTATDTWRSQIRSLAAEVAKDAGEHYRDDAAATFEAASTSDEWAPVLKAGRLMATLSPSGFGLQDMPDPVLTRPPADAAPARDDAAIEAARTHLDKLDAALEKATHSLRRAEQRLDQARVAVAEAEAARDRARAARDQAAEALQRLDA